jgi:3-phosphoshikimate 1-carboxyvinyltransferase
MAFAVAGLAVPGKTVIRDADCAAVSFPDFFDLLDRVTDR